MANRKSYTFNRQPLDRRRFIRLSVAGTATLMAGGAISGCAPTTQGDLASTSNAMYASGTYTGTGTGKKGDITVAATFSDDAIESIEVVDSYETERISRAAFEKIPQTVLDLQTLNVDTVSGATLASMGVLAAIADCVEQAGGDVDALKAGAAAERSADTIELECDIAVLGAGAAGMAAALGAAQEGAEVVVLEKSSFFGGNCLVSAGVMEYTNAPESLRTDASGSWKTYFDNRIAEHREAGTDAALIDEVQKQWDDYYAAGATKVFSSPEFLTLDLMMLEGNTYDFQHSYAKDVDAACEWLTELGIDWKPLAGIVGYPYPHFSNSTDGVCGEGYFNLYEKHLDEDGLPITMLMETPAEKLLVEDGRVAGVTGTCVDGTTYTVHASKGVVVCTGGYSANRDMLVEHDILWDWASLPEVPCDNTWGHTGDGIRMAQEVGARFDTLPYNQMVLPTVNARTMSTEDQIWNPSLAFILNGKGERFVDEGLDRYSLTRAIMEQGGEVWGLSSAENCLVENGIYTYTGVDVQHLIDTGSLYRADTLEELADKCGFDKDTLVGTVDRFNEAVETGVDKDCGRTAFEPSCAIKTPPFYAFPATWAMHITLDGIAADGQGRVLDEAGNPIPGLYAAGEVVCGSRGVGSQGKGLAAARNLVAE